MEKMMMEYMQKMNNLADDLKERDKTRDNQLQQVFKQLGVREQGNLPATSEPNPREQLRAITLRSGKELQGPEVKASIDEVPVETFIETTPQKKSESIPQETRKEETSFSQPQPTRKTQLNTIPFPTRVKKSKDEKAFQKFLDVIGQVEVKMPLVNVLTEMPKYGKFLKNLVSKKRDWEEFPVVSLNAECSAMLLEEMPRKRKDPGCFIIPCSINDRTFGDALADLGASINLIEGQCPVVIASDLTPDQKEKLLAVLRTHKQAIAWKLEDIQGISPAYCTHKIAIEDGFKPVMQALRRPTYPNDTRADVHLVGSGPIERFEMWGRHRSLTESMYMSSTVLADYRYAEEMEQLLRGTRWHRLFTMRAESSLPLTIEFLCSLELEPSSGSRMMNFQSIDSRTTLTFTLMGWGFQPRSLSWPLTWVSTLGMRRWHQSLIPHRTFSQQTLILRTFGPNILLILIALRAWVEPGFGFSRLGESYLLCFRRPSLGGR
ncbi:unnamed protein product [Cuscuta campestris]|uniref:Uncharacterized protein n=1 Tax=Cuscuta campestris TaxID=132261 RepID=A0A484LBS6_9ASTE|nr:unnamed protein product [Cuscuta campestris]